MERMWLGVWVDPAPEDTLREGVPGRALTLGGNPRGIHLGPVSSEYVFLPVPAKEHLKFIGFSLILSFSKMYRWKHSLD